jgi:transposase
LGMSGVITARSTKRAK